MPPGVGVLPIMTYKGRVYLRPDERVGILLLVQVYKRVGESVILVCKRTLKG